MQVIRGVESRGFTSRYPNLRRLGVAAKLWASNWGEARPEGCVVAAARRRGGWAQPVWEPRARAAGVCGVPGFGSGWGGLGGRCLCLGLRRGRGRGPGRPAVAARRWRLLTPALRCSRSWLPAAALTPGAPPGAALAPRVPAAGQQVAAVSLPPSIPNAA